MKVIDLLNKIANGEKQEDNKYQFSYVDYCTIKEFFNRYIVDEENLNLEVLDIEEDKKILTLKNLNLTKIDINKAGQVYGVTKKEMIADIQTLQNWINEIIDYINKENKE